MTTRFHAFTNAYAHACNRAACWFPPTAEAIREFSSGNRIARGEGSSARRAVRCASYGESDMDSYVDIVIHTSVLVDPDGATAP
jgi:hypothetical protein